jgi:lauroyl/myristoyl acyltransferase
VLAFFRSHLGDDAPMTLESTAASAIVSALRAGADVIANIDVAYPGTRTTAMPLSGGTLRVPAGLPTLAKRAGVTLRPMALVQTGASLRLHTGDAVDPTRSDAAATIATVGAFFGPVVAAAPEQWLGWPGLTLPEDSPGG